MWSKGHSLVIWYNYKNVFYLYISCLLTVNRLTLDHDQIKFMLFHKIDTPVTKFVSKEINAIDIEWVDNFRYRSKNVLKCGC